MPGLGSWRSCLVSLLLAPLGCSYFSLTESRGQVAQGVLGVRAVGPEEGHMRTLSTGVGPAPPSL